MFQQTLSLMLALFVAWQSPSSTLACLCPIPKIETGFAPDSIYMNNPAVLKVKLRQRLDTSDLDPWDMYPDRFEASVRTAFWADSCRTMRELRGATIQVRTGGVYVSCGSVFEEDTTYLMSGSLEYDEDSNMHYLTITDCNFSSEWSDLTDEERAYLDGQRRCRCRSHACGPKPDLPNYECPNELATIAGPSDICRYDRSTQQCTWLVECPTCLDDYDCEFVNGERCSEEGICEVPTAPVDSIARQIWADAGGDETINWTEDDSAYPWYSYEPCIQHPTFRFGSEAAYTAMAVALTKVFQDPRLTPDVLYDGMPVNSEANIPMSNCGDLVSFSKEFLEGYSLVNNTVSAALIAARVAAGY